MHGRFTSNLREFAHDYAAKLKFQIEEEEQREKEQDEFRSFHGSTFLWQLKCMFCHHSYHFISMNGSIGVNLAMQIYLP